MDSAPRRCRNIGRPPLPAGEGGRFPLEPLVRTLPHSTAWPGRPRETSSTTSCKTSAAGRRLNVALTRAKHKLIILGDTSVLNAHPAYYSLIRHCTVVHPSHLRP